jgi:hypothetical protein
MVSESIILGTRAIGKRIIEQDRLRPDGVIETARNESLGAGAITVGGKTIGFQNVNIETVEEEKYSPAPIDLMPAEITVEGFVTFGDAMDSLLK